MRFGFRTFYRFWFRMRILCDSIIFVRASFFPNFLLLLFFLVRSSCRKSVVALIGLRFHPAASQLSAFHLRQLRHFEIERWRSIKEERCYRERRGEDERRRKEAIQNTAAQKESMCSFPMEIRFTNNKQKARTKMRIETSKTSWKISCEGDGVVIDDDGGVGKKIVLEKKEKWRK